jgi:hypothetical protein
LPLKSSLFIWDSPYVKLLGMVVEEDSGRRLIPSRLRSEHAATEAATAAPQSTVRDGDVPFALRRVVPKRLVVVGHNDLLVLAVLETVEKVGIVDGEEGRGELDRF